MENFGSSIVAVGSFVFITCILAVFQKYSTVRDMFLPSSVTTGVGRWMSLFCLINWICSITFFITALQVASKQSAIRHDIEGRESHDKVTLVVCFLSLVYLIGYYSVSAVVGSSSEESEDSISQTPEGGNKETSSLFLVLPVSYFAVACAVLLRVDSSMETKTTVGTACAIGLGALIHAIKYSSLNKVKRDGNDFNDTIIGSTRLLSNPDSVLSRDRVEARVQSYDDLYAGARKNVGEISSEESIKKRQREYQVMVDSFYDLVTDFYEYGWGQSFHFANRHSDETFRESIARAEHFLSSRLQLTPEKKCLDMGCGVGGPLRSIARFSGATIEGITLNEYQVRVANRYNHDKGLEKTCNVVQGDFMALPWEEGTFDGVYAIESTCHAPNKTKCYGEAFRVLKEGGLFVGYEWTMVRKYDKTNMHHVQLKEGIEVGNGLPTIATPEEVVDALKAAGFEVLEHFDMHDGAQSKHQIPWYNTLQGSMTLSGFRMTRAGRFCTHILVSVLEFLKIAPKGSVRVSKILNDTADDLVEAGELDIFTPDYFFLARKPVQTIQSS